MGQRFLISPQCSVRLVMDKNQSSWVVEEFSCLELNDQRLNARFMKLADDFSKHPEFPINQACEDWRSTKAAYRFFKNEKFDEQDLLRPHIKNTAKRCQKQELVLVIQDMTVFGYSHHPKTKGLGPIGGHSDPVQKSQGFNLHAALAVSTQGVPLGLLSGSFFTRNEMQNTSNEKGKRTDHLLPTEEKESFKWIYTLEQTQEALDAKVRAVTICDRESDFHDFYLAALSLGTDVLVRCNADRNVGTRAKPFKLSERLAQTETYPEAITHTVPVKKMNSLTVNQGSRLRKAVLEVKSTQATLTPSRKLSQVVKEQITLTVVEAREVNTPEGLEPVHWILFTTLSVESYEEALIVLEFYSMRWKIEEYFKVLKSGCTVEKCRLAEGDRLKRYVALFSVIAWRIYWMTFIKRISPELSCETALTKNEWQCLYRWKTKDSQAPPDIPTIGEAIVWVARLGGFLARKNDGEPGPITIWRGWSRLQDLVLMNNLTQSRNPTYG